MPASEPIDERLRALLAVEERLQRVIAEAREAADRRVAEARGACDRLLAGTDEAIALANEDEARADRAAHTLAIRDIERRHQAAMGSLAAISDSVVDQLARRALARLLEGAKEPS